ncbi:MAG: AAA family ATPase, partial [Verrucomicrobia bacterium]|nr:AAA family ATPase [Leptolyngbya sp. ES-bin-22]
MLTKLRLTNFKGFKDAELTLGEFTLLVGTNASGKSNIRDAFRFLHGISREYNLAEIIGEGYGGGGFIRWFGIRGGTRDLVFRGARAFAIEIFFSLKTDQIQQEASYRIEIDPGIESGETDAVESPRILTERLKISGQKDNIFEAV